MYRPVPSAIPGVAAMAALVAALVLSCTYKPTPTNGNAGGPGSSYPHSHRAVSYSHPVNGGGSQSS